MRKAPVAVSSSSATKCKEKESQEGFIIYISVLACGVHNQPILLYIWFVGIESLSDGPFDLDTDAMIADIGDEMVPILAPDYDDTNPIKG